MIKNILTTLICCLLSFSTQSSWAESETLTLGTNQENGTWLRSPSFDTLVKLSESETITMRLPNHPWNETHFGTSDEETHVITLSHIDDTVYVLGLYELDEEGSEAPQGDDVMIAGYRARSNRMMVDGVAAQEFLYGWAGQTFADTVLAKEVPLELHSYAIQSTDHLIVLMVCGPSDQSLEAKVLEYTQSLEIRQWDQL